MSEEICKNCKYHYTEEISFDYPQSCCNKTNPNHTTEEWLHCDCFEYSKNYITNLQQRIEQLEKENKELRDENMRIFRNVNDDELLISNAMNYAELKKAEKRLEQLENIRKEAIKATKDVKQFVYDELVDRNVSGATETHCKIMDLLNILNKGSDKE